MTDPHVHLRDWNQSDKETVEHGMKTGAAAGFDRFFDMPNSNPPVTDRATVEKRLALGRTAELSLKKQGYDVHYHLYLGITSDRHQIREMIQAYKDFFPRVCGLKMFASQSTGNMGIIGKDPQAKVYQALADFDYRGVIAVHCEKEELFISEPYGERKLKHSEKRPSESEAESVRDQIENAEKSGFKGTLHIVHISTAAALETVKKIRKTGGLTITCAATPHHILLNTSNETNIVKMNPPLRSESDRLAVWNGLFDGTIDWIESDHAPHTLSDKLKGACGLPGFEGMLMTIKALRKAGMTEKKLNSLFSGNVLKAFGMNLESSEVPEVTDAMINAARCAYPVSAWN